MSRSRVPAVLTVALALVMAVATGLGTAAGAATPPAPAPTATPVPTAISPLVPTALDPSPSPSGPRPGNAPPGEPTPSNPTPSPTDTITIVSAGTAPVPGGVQLSVTAESTTPIVTMNAHLLDATTSDPVLVVPMNPPAGGAKAGESIWTVTLAVGTPPTGLPLGDYVITVDATDQGGYTLPAGPTVATLPFVDVPSITPDRDSAVISFDNQTPVISGRVTVLAPGATAPAPYAGRLVYIADSLLAGGGASVQTDASGDYRYTFTSPQARETFTVEVPQAPDTAAGSAPPVTFTVRTDRVAISASLSAGTVSYGSKPTVHGTVTYQPGTAFVPLRGITVRVFDGRPGGSPVVTAVTDGSGRFTATLPRATASVDWVLVAAGRYLSTATRTLPMKVDLPTVVSGFQVALNQLWQLSFRGCLALRGGVPGSIPSLSGLVIQYSAGRNGPWHTLGTPMSRRDSIPCGNGGRTFSGTLTARLNYAYYRAWYPGATDASGNRYQACASGLVLAWKYADRITAFTVSARTVRQGGNLTVKGRLQYFSSGSWRSYARQQVYVILRPKGSGTWYYLVTATTDATGRFSSTFADPVSATWSAEFFGNSTHLATMAALIYVAVTGGSGLSRDRSG